MKQKTVPVDRDREAAVSLRRIVVALDASSCSRAALAAAAHMAELMQSELIGLFVEDINLLRLYQLPFSQEIAFWGATSRKLEGQQIEQLLRLRAAEVRRELEAETEKRRIVSHFRVVRGAVHSEILAAALEADLLALGQLGHSIARRSRLGSTARMVMTQAGVSVLLTHPNLDLERPIAILYDGSAGSKRALQIASGLAQQSDVLDVFIWVATHTPEASLHQRILEEVQALRADVKVNIQPLVAADAASLIRLLRQHRPGLLVLGTTDSLLPADLIEVLVEDGSQQILAVR